MSMDGFYTFEATHQKAAFHAKDQTKESGNVLRWEKGAWRIRFDGDEATFPDRQGCFFRHLCRLLKEPNRHFRARDFFPPPPGVASVPYLGRDESSDDRAFKECNARMKALLQEIKEADDAHDTESAAKSRKEFDKLAAHLEKEEGARKRGRKKRCGSLSPIEKADQNLRMGLKRLIDRFRKKGLEKLANHLEEYLSHENAEWWYAPPSNTAPWHISRPDTFPES